MAAILAKSKNVESKKQELTAAERKSLFEMSMEEVLVVLLVTLSSNGHLFIFSSPFSYIYIYIIYTHVYCVCVCMYVRGGCAYVIHQ